jgi:glutamate dehydrogenase (NAD(P)+)
MGPIRVLAMVLALETMTKAPADNERLIRAFARAIRSLTEHIPGPDMGTDERCMAWVKDEIDRAVGLPRVLGGIPLDEIGATGWGVAIAAEVAAPEAGISLDRARVAIEGFGGVGQHVVRFVAARGARLVAASDSRGAIHHPDGLPVDALMAHKRGGRPLTDFPGRRTIGREALVGVPCEIWIPAARPDGGVICAATEYHGGTQAQAFAAIEERIRANTRETFEHARTDRVPPREAATRMARSRIREAMCYRRPLTPPGSDDDPSRANGGGTCPPRRRCCSRWSS